MIPPSNDANKKDRSRSEQLILPRQALSREETGPFLEFLFSEIARKPKALKLKETSRVARYLKAVAWEAQGSPERDTVEHLANVIWLAMLQSGKIEIAEKKQAIHFLRDHAHTYLASFEVDKIVGYLEKLKEPSRHAEFFRPPKLMGAKRSLSGKGPGRLQDDLTERIYVGYHALRRARIGNARGRIATVLNRLGFAPGARSATERMWGSYEVIERVQQFEDRIARQLRLSKQDRTKQERLRDILVDSWIHGFHFALTGLVLYQRPDHD